MFSHQQESMALPRWCTAKMQMCKFHLRHGSLIPLTGRRRISIDWMTKSLESRGMTEPWHHGTSRPPIVEAEATHRALALAELMDTPILIVHVSAPNAVSYIRKAQTRLLPVYAETCPHYAVLDGREMRREGFEGAKCVCAPPLRDNPTDKEKIWEGLANGTFTVWSSDHAPTRFNDPMGKQVSLSICLTTTSAMMCTMYEFIFSSCNGSSD